MEITAAAAPEAPSASAGPSNKRPVAGFICMLAGPGLLLGAELFTDAFGNLSGTAAQFLALTAVLLPGAGLVLGVMTLCRWKKTGVPGRALAIVTVLMCNPFFYYFYIFICLLTSSELTGRAMGM